jgi:hypothetical protein
VSFDFYGLGEAFIFGIRIWENYPFSSHAPWYSTLSRSFKLCDEEGFHRSRSVEAMNIKEYKKKSTSRNVGKYSGSSS